MREILFRGKRDPKYGTKKDWWYGVPYIDHEGDCIMTTRCSNTVVIPETVGQFTGLYDATKWEDLSESEQQEWLKNHIKHEWNGRKIFEGDIVKTKYGRLCKVIWFEPQVCFDLVPIGTLKNLERNPPDKFDLWQSKNLEVIGNIYDNPELLQN